MVEVGIERVRRVLQLVQRTLQRVDDGGDARVVLGHVAQRIDRAAGQRLGIALVGVGHLLQGHARGVDQRLRMGQALVFGVQFVPFAVVG